MNCKMSANPFRLLLALLCLAGLARADVLQDAQDAYKKGDYATAARDFETALKAKGPMAGVYYNLGMAQLKNGQRPEAALSFHRALLLDPRLADAQVELSNLDRSQGVPPAPASWREKIAGKVPLAPLIIVGTAIAWLGAFLLLAAIFKSGPKAGAIFGAIVIALLGKGLALAGCLADPRLSDRKSALIMGSEVVTLLSAPADQSATVAKLPPGTEVQLLRRSGDWTCLKLATGEEGWTSSKAFAAVVPGA